MQYMGQELENVELWGDIQSVEMKMPVDKPDNQADAGDNLV